MKKLIFAVVYFLLFSAVAHAKLSPKAAETANRYLALVPPHSEVHFEEARSTTNGNAVLRHVTLKSKHTGAINTADRILIRQLTEMSNAKPYVLDISIIGLEISAQELDAEAVKHEEIAVVD